MMQWILDNMMKCLEDENHLRKLNESFIEAQRAQRNFSKTLERLGLG